MRRVLSLWLPCVAYMALVYDLSSRQVAPGPAPDVVLHLVEYAILGALLARAFAGGSQRVGRGAVALAFLAGTLYGITDEYHQSFVPGRDPSAKDVLMDALGSAGGAMGAAAWASIGARSARG